MTNSIEKHNYQSMQFELPIKDQSGTMLDVLKPVLVTLPNLGIKIAAPEEIKEKIIFARKEMETKTRMTEDEKKTINPQLERERLIKLLKITPKDKEKLNIKLSLISSCSILKKRYPTKEIGKSFIETQVDYEWVEELLKKVNEIKTKIISSWNKIEINKPIAIILFGSVAKCLIKNKDHEFPSNIDIAVIGDITNEEREQLFDKIREAREIIKDTAPVGVHIQNIKKLTCDYFNPTINYIKSGAIAIYDPNEIWKNLENNAIEYEIKKRKKTKPRIKTKNKIITDFTNKKDQIIFQPDLGI
ncbi:MAG: hypothetical protein NTZ20_02370 [Candidatus Levybacteria bacterium]|nr:hypothetical protein [Candidatus Levybacteria bacterium]